MDIAAKNRFRDRFNLIPIDIKGEIFFEALSADVVDYLRDNPQPIAQTASPNDARIFGSQFNFLHRLHPKNGELSKKHDFYAGDEPSWADISTELDARTQVATTALRYIEDQWKEGNLPIIIITGSPGCGKSTTLLRILKDCAKNTDAIYLFRGEERMDVEAVTRCLRPDSVVVFGFDIAADFSSGIYDLVKALEKRNFRFAIVAVDRDRRKEALYNDLRKTTPLVLDQSQATDGDAGRLYSARKTHYRLGSYTSKSESEFRKLVLRKHEANIFSAMAEIEGGHGFERRLDDFVASNINKKNLISLAHGVSLTHRWGYPLPLRSASLVSGIDPVQIGRMCAGSGELSDIFTIESKGVKFRHRILANHFFQRRRDYQERYDSLVSVISSLGPHVTLDSIRRRSYPYLICRAIADRRAVIDAVGRLESARKLFDAIEPILGGNSRFWEQRALLESEAGDHPKAYSFAHEAIARERHTFPLTTLGRICMAQAVDIGLAHAESALGRFREGASSLLEARSIARKSEVIGHPFTCFFDYALKFHNIAASTGGGQRYLVDAWQGWMEEAKRTQAIPLEEIDKFERKWLLTAVSDS